MQRFKTEFKGKQRGFTLAEMLAVVLIISLLAGLGGGIYVGTYRRLLVERAARDLVLTARYARIMAIEQQQQYRIQLDVANGGFYLVTTQFNEEDDRAEQMTVRNAYCRPVQFEGQVQFEDIQITPIGLETESEVGDEQTIAFSPGGTAQSAIIQVGDAKTHYTVGIWASTGKAKVYFGTTENVELGTVDLDAE